LPRSAMSDARYSSPYAPYSSPFPNMSQPYLSRFSIHNQQQFESNDENLDESSVSRLIPRVENVRLVNFADITGYDSVIRTAQHPSGLVVTPVNDMIKVITGQDNSNAGKSWNNLSFDRKAEIQKDLTEFEVSGIHIFIKQYLF
jgi:hypothetical protein